MKSQNNSGNYNISIGIVKSNSDPMQQGRLQIYVPAVDALYHEDNSLPWALYVSPFGGVVANLKVGRSNSQIKGATSYGFWAVPKVGAQVLCGFIDGDIDVRYWLGCIFPAELNRTLPQSIDGGLTEIDDTGYYPQSTIKFQNDNLVSAGLQPGSKHYKTRGGYERSVSYPVNKTNTKPTTNGYAPKTSQLTSADSQTICLTSPGRHYLVMSDVDDYCRIRLKTTEGSQIIFDDTNERIYISTAKGKNWIEMDEGNGKIYVYSDSKISIRAKNNIDFYSDENINLVAKKRVNIKSETRSINLESVHDIRMLSSQADILMTASRDIQLKTTNGPLALPIASKSVCSIGTSGWSYEWSEKGGSSTSSIKIDSANEISASASTDLNLTSKNLLNLRSMSKDITLQSSQSVNLNAELDINIFGSSINIPGNPVIANVADNVDAVQSNTVTDQMILPDHEPWTRDIDEQKCKTPRNKSYQG